MSHELLTLTPQQILERAIEYESGIVNFRMLHTLLHILINNIDGMDTLRVKLCNHLNDNELNEKECDFSEKQIPKRSVVLTEYLVGKDGKKLNEITKTGGTNVVKKIITVANSTEISHAAPTDVVRKSRSNSSMATIDDNNATIERLGKIELTENSSVGVKIVENSDDNSDKCEKRLGELENVIKNLTTIVNDLTRNFHLFTTEFAKKEEIGQIKSKLDEVEKDFRETHGNDSDKRTAQKQIVLIEKENSGETEHIVRISLNFVFYVEPKFTSKKKLLDCIYQET